MLNKMLLVVVLGALTAAMAAEEGSPLQRRQIRSFGYRIALVAANGKAQEGAPIDDHLRCDDRAVDQLNDELVQRYIPSARKGRGKVAELLAADLQGSAKRWEVSDEDAKTVAAAAKKLFSCEAGKYWSSLKLEALLPYLGRAFQEQTRLLEKATSARYQVKLGLALQEALALAYTARLVADMCTPPPAETTTVAIHD